MDEPALRTAFDRVDAALARIEAALARRWTADQPSAAALAALEKRHAALREVLETSVHELDMLLSAADQAPGA